VELPAGQDAATSAPGKPSAHAPRSPARRRLLKLLLGGAALTLPTTAFAYYVEPFRLVVEHRKITLKGWPRALAGYRIGHLSDFHCDSERSVQRTAQAAQALLAERPDVVCLTGDYITARPQKWAAPCAEALSSLTQVEGGVFAVLGNHDHWSGFPHIVVGALRDVGINVLDNHTVPLKVDRSVWLVGLGDRCVNKHDCASALRRTPSKALKILLIHEPDYADESPAGFALQLSGHSHGGQIKVPGLPPIHTPKYARHYREGLEHGPRHPIYVTRGIGTMGIPMRFGCPPEVTVLEIHPA
jgi:predicted MPP superfamily phosphohydrolase